MIPETVLKNIKTEILEDFEARILEEIDNEYHNGETKLIDGLEFDEESSDKSIDDFKQWLRDMASEVEYPPYEGLFIRILYRDFLYIQHKDKENEV